jgi:hypothetical protein
MRLVKNICWHNKLARRLLLSGKLPKNAKIALQVQIHNHIIRPNFSIRVKYNTAYKRIRHYKISLQSNASRPRQFLIVAHFNA